VEGKKAGGLLLNPDYFLNISGKRIMNRAEIVFREESYRIVGSCLNCREHGA